MRDDALVRIRLVVVTADLGHEIGAVTGLRKDGLVRVTVVTVGLKNGSMASLVITIVATGLVSGSIAALLKKFLLVGLGNRAMLATVPSRIVTN